MQGGHDRAARAEKDKNVLVVDEDPRANPTSCSVVTDSRSSRVQMHGGGSTVPALYEIIKKPAKVITWDPPDGVHPHDWRSRGCQKGCVSRFL
jgi:hypothetical protein